MLFSNTFSNSLKNLAKIIICFCLVYTPFFANAGAAEKWEILENVYDEPRNSVNITARKITQDAANTSVYKVKVPVSAAEVGATALKRLAGGLVGAVAIAALVEGVGWVIDSSTNKYVKTKPVGGEYKIANFTSSTPKGALQKYLDSENARLGYGDKHQYQEIYFSLDSQVLNSNGTYTYTYCTTWYSRSACMFKRAVQGTYTDIQTIPLTAGLLGAMITGDNYSDPVDSSKDAQVNGNPQADIITQVYTPTPDDSTSPAPDKTNQHLNNANPEPAKEPEGKAETDKEKDDEGNETGKTTTSFELPKFCEWAPAVCDFFTVQKEDNAEIKENQKLDTEQNKTFFEKVSDWFDWTREPPQKDNDDNEIDIEEIPIPENSVNVSIGDNTCPSMPVNIHTPFNTISTDISPVYLCQIATGMKTFFIALGFFTASLIVGRRN